MTPGAATSLHMPTEPFIAPFIDADAFSTLVEQAQGLAVVDFTADHCPPCRTLGPQVDALARELAGRAVVAKVDVDQQPALTARFGIRGTPTVLFFRDGQPVDRIVGAAPLARLREKVDALGRPRLDNRFPGGPVDVPHDFE
jgi:thioredoxin